MHERQTSWIQLCEQSDVVSSLQACLRNIQAIEEDPSAWKWVIISMHLALQGAMVCHLSGSAGFGALTKKSVEETQAWHERDRQRALARSTSGGENAPPTEEPCDPKDPYPEEHLADPLTLLKRLTNEKKRFDHSGGGHIHLEDRSVLAFKRLHKSFRNHFVHFSPKSWSIEVTSMPRILLDSLDIADKVAADPYPFRNLDDSARVTLSNTLISLRTSLEVLDAKLRGRNRP